MVKKVDLYVYCFQRWVHIDIDIWHIWNMTEISSGNSDEKNFHEKHSNEENSNEENFNEKKLSLECN